jgi:hypothetical protein
VGITVHQCTQVNVVLENKRKEQKDTRDVQTTRVMCPAEYHVAPRVDPPPVRMASNALAHHTTHTTKVAWSIVLYDC